MECLAPAGNREALERADAAGADAVYLGYAAFSARAGAGNFQRDPWKIRRTGRTLPEKDVFLPGTAAQVQGSQGIYSDPLFLLQSAEQRARKRFLILFSVCV